MDQRIIFQIKSINDKKMDRSKKTIENYSYYHFDKIGKGFSSIVYKGKNQHNCTTHSSAQTIAIKIIDGKGLKDNIAKQMLENETNILKQLKHENILNCYDVIKSNNQCYIITQYCNGGDLANFLKKKGRLCQTQVLKYLKQIISGFKIIAEKNILHRDLKPANIFLNNNICKIADFGFAKKNVSQGVKQRYNVGSPLYMSPQALKKNIYSIKTDIWAIGIIAYELLFGRTPWDCRTQKELIEKMLKVPVIFPSSQKASDQMKLFIRRCLQVDESKRSSLDDILNSSIYSNNNVIDNINHNSINDNYAKIKNNNKQQEIILKQRVNNEENRLRKTQTTKMILSQTMQKLEKKENKQKSERFSVFNKMQSLKQNKKNIQSDITIIVQKINVCRLIYKLSKQLDKDSILQPHLRNQLNNKIILLNSGSYTQKVKKVVNQYYNKYTNQNKDKPQHVMQDFEQKALEEFSKMNQWGKQLLVGYLHFLHGKTEKLSQSLDRPKKLSQKELQYRLNQIKML